MSSSSQEASASSSRKANAPTSYGDSCSALSCFSNSWGFCASTRRAVSKIWREQRQFLSSTMGRRSEEHTSELQSRLHLVCRLLLEKKKSTAMPTDVHGTADPFTHPKTQLCGPT